MALLPLPERWLRALLLALRPEPFRSRLVPLPADRVEAVLLRLLRLVPVAFRPVLAAARSVRLLPLRPLVVPLRFRLEVLLALRSSRLEFRSLRPALVVPRPFRDEVPERSVAAVRVRVVERVSSEPAAACSWSIRCPASLVQLCPRTPRAASWRTKLAAAASFGKGPTSRRLFAI